ncbi:MAG TPA: biotin/lipoyl-containing protein [Nitrososphaeraceae archaeon]|nr:biotin/lipoyl-containing protein [Nitrososphaeraceae archaeon]
MQFQIEGQTKLINAELVQNKGAGDLLFEIDGKQFNLKILKSQTDDFEFILGNTFHHAKILSSSETKYKIFIDGILIEIKKHSKITEIIEKSLKVKGTVSRVNNITSQIPGRVVKISVSIGDAIKEGEPLIVLESMKMQIAIKSNKNGVVKEINVSEGSTVARNEVVAVIE